MSTSLPAVGTRVTFRHWDSDPWMTGTIESYYTGAYGGTEYVTIARDGYRETHTLPVSKMADPALFGDAPAVHAVSVGWVPNNHGYPFRASCSCGWQSRTYVADDAATAMADAHMAGAL